MESKTEIIRAKLSEGILEKADLLFRNDNDGLWIELLQNSRRAGATVVEISIEESVPRSGPRTVTLTDNGHGIKDFQNLLTLGGSGWDHGTQGREQPAGMGFFSLCRSTVEVHSGSRSMKIGPAVFLGREEASVVQTDEYVQGTRLRFTRDSDRASLIESLERVTRYYPVEVRVDGVALPRQDFLEGALYRELIDGIEVGLSTNPQWGWERSNWNFYGALLYDSFEGIPGVICTATRGITPLYFKFNVIETGRVKLQLPDRRGIIQDQFLIEFHLKARTAAYRFIQSVGCHALPFKYWQEARSLGVELPESVYLLSSWHADPKDPNNIALFDEPGLRRLSHLSGVLLVDRGLPNAHTLEGALRSSAFLSYSLFRAEKDRAGYAWYNALPRIVDTAVFVDGMKDEEWVRTGRGRPEQIEVEITVEQAGRRPSKLRLPASIHVRSDRENEADFVAIKDSPWDNERLCGPFSVSDFILWATFSADCDADSWENQRYEYQKLVERIVIEYFRGPKAALLEILQTAIDSKADELANETGVNEIRFRRRDPGSARWGWNIELIQCETLPSEQQQATAS